MPRRPRLALAGHVHHLIQRGVNRQAIFFEDGDRRVFLARLGETLPAEGCALHAYVLMTNHVHLLVTPDRDGGVGRLMQSPGPTLCWPCQSRPRPDRHLVGRAFQIDDHRQRSLSDGVPSLHRGQSAARRHGRPSGRAPVVQRGHNGEGRSDPLITEHELYRALGASAAERRLAYRELFAEGLDERLLHTLRDTAQRGWIAGNDRFREEIETTLRRRLGPPIRGRPKRPKGEKGSE